MTHRTPSQRRRDREAAAALTDGPTFHFDIVYINELTQAIVVSSVPREMPHHVHRYFGVSQERLPCEICDA